MQHFSILSRTPLFYENVWKMIENNAFTSVMLSSISSTVERNAISLFAFQDTPAGTLQRKKSLPDVQCLDVTTKAQGSKAMTREEISVLSSARREAVRKQLEEIEAYKSNPFLYILNPRVKVSFVHYKRVSWWIISWLAYNWILEVVANFWYVFLSLAKLNQNVVSWQSLKMIAQKSSSQCLKISQNVAFEKGVLSFIILWTLLDLLAN